MLMRLTAWKPPGGILSDVVVTQAGDAGYSFDWTTAGRRIYVYLHVQEGAMGR